MRSHCRSLRAMPARGVRTSAALCGDQRSPPLKGSVGPASLPETAYDYLHALVAHSQRKVGRAWLTWSRMRVIAIIGDAGLSATPPCLICGNVSGAETKKDCQSRSIMTLRTWYWRTFAILNRHLVFGPIPMGLSPGQHTGILGKQSSLNMLFCRR